MNTIEKLYLLRNSLFAVIFSLFFSGQLFANWTPADITDLILVTGQSNVRGSQTTGFDPTLDATHPRVFAFTTTRSYMTDPAGVVKPVYSTGGTWQLADLHQAWDINGWEPGNGSLNDPFRESYNNFAFHFAKTLVQNDPNPNRVVGIVIASAPGEGIQHWDVGGDFGGPEFIDGRAFAEVVETQALSALNAQGVKSGFDAVLWHQGETDWLETGTSDIDVIQHYSNDNSYDPSTDPTYYPDKLSELISRFRSSGWFSTGKPFICGETKSADVNSWLNSLNTDGDAWTGCVMGSDLSTRDAATHFDAQGLRTLGQRYGAKYLAMTNSQPTCNGLAITVSIELGQLPTTGDDVILGTQGDDSIAALGGNDTICGLGGNDTINAGVGDDWVDAGSGDDSVFGLGGADFIYGRSGADEIVSGAGNDLIFGNDGADTLNSGPGNDVVHGGAGADLIYAQGGDDLVHGGAGNDFIIGVDGVDELYGDEGNDVINGGPGNDEVYGDEGADTIYGSSGNDVLNGGGGDDFVFGQLGSDTIVGGAGNDHLWGNEDNDLISDESGNNVINGGAGDDTITGGSGNDEIFGDGNLQQAGNDVIVGGAGIDLLVGFAGADTISAIDGEVDTINGGPGIDICTVESADTVFNCP